MIEQTIDGISFHLKEAYDFSFLTRWGRVIKVFDGQDSGNICFGLENASGRLFVKFAGARTVEYDGEVSKAAEMLKRSALIYRELAHGALIRYRFAEDVGGGFALAFDWTDAVCMGKQYPESRERFLKMPDETRLRLFGDIVDFHIHAIKKGYIAVDFYDGCIMYDFDAGRTLLCDIDYYEKRPFKNNMGRMWGSTRFMSPEEYILGADIDERTNVFLMGAVAFALFGGEADRSAAKWRLNGELYDIAIKAASPEREKRFASISEFSKAWNMAFHP